MNALHEMMFSQLAAMLSGRDVEEVSEVVGMLVNRMEPASKMVMLSAMRAVLEAEGFMEIGG